MQGTMEQVSSCDCCIEHDTVRDMNSASNIGAVVKEYLCSGSRPTYLQEDPTRPTYAEPHKRRVVEDGSSDEEAEENEGGKGEEAERDEEDVPGQFPVYACLQDADVTVLISRCLRV